jgi:hypothetical protein
MPQPTLHSSPMGSPNSAAPANSGNMARIAACG